MERFRLYSQQACKYNTLYLTISKMPNRIVEVVFIAGLLLSSIFCIGRGGDASLYVTQLGTFAVAAVRILPSISSIAVYMNGLIYFRPTVEATYQNLSDGENRDYKTERIALVEQKDGGMDIRFNNVISVRNISWKYADNFDYVLEDVSLDIRRGEAIAFIGASGAGKTTLADILLGLLVPEKGRITVDGMDIFANPVLWSKMVGYVPQSSFLLDDAIRNNRSEEHTSELQSPS